MARRRFNLGADSLVVELASNDGYLLKNFLKMGIPVLGIDPSATVARAAEDIGVPTLVEFFGESLARKLASEGRAADLIVGNNVLAHVPQLNDFVAGIAALLKPRGTATIEFPHLLKLIEHVEFDTIYHEHYSYLSLTAIEHVFSTARLAYLRCRGIADARRVAAHFRGARAPRGPHGQRTSAASCGRRRRRPGSPSSTLTAASRSASRPAGARCSNFSRGRNARRDAWPRTAPRPRATRCLNFCGVSAGGHRCWSRTRIRTSSASFCRARISPWSRRRR